MRTKYSCLACFSFVKFYRRRRREEIFAELSIIRDFFIKKNNPSYMNVGSSCSLVLSSVMTDVDHAKNMGHKKIYLEKFISFT